MKVWYILMLLVQQWGKVGIITINSVPPTESSWICHFLIGQIKPIFFFHNAHTVYYTCAFSSLPSVLFFFNDYLVIRHWLGSSKLPPLLGIGTLRNYDGDGNGNVKKAISLMSKTTSCPCIKLFCTFLCSPYTTTTWNDQISREREEELQGDKFFHLCQNLGAVPSLQLQTEFSSFK